MDRAEKAVGYKHSGSNCTQAVLFAFADILGREQIELKALGAPFGCGMGAFDATCGALIAAQMVLGMSCFSGKPMLSEAKALHGAFKKLCGSVDCGELKGLKTGKMLCSCDDCIRSAVKLAEERVCAR